MEIHLDLCRHCIETAARLKVEGLIRSYFKDPDPGAEDRITTLTRFLEQADFQDLRTRINRFHDRPGTMDAKAILIFSKDLQLVKISFNNQSIYPAPTI